MDDIYVTVRMRMKLYDDKQYLCNGIDVAIDSKDATRNYHKTNLTHVHPQINLVVIEGSCGIRVVNTVCLCYNLYHATFSSYPTGVTSCLVITDQLANVQERLIKSGDMKKQ